jgi:8-oxo-dGTP pyrophosphatase MutT (NUDIX family)
MRSGRLLSQLTAHTLATVRPRDEVAVFITRLAGREVLLVHRVPKHGDYWHVVAGGVEPGETAAQAAQREMREETTLEAPLRSGVGITEYMDARDGEPAEQPTENDPLIVGVHIDCFCVEASDGWEPTLNWEHDSHRWCSPTAAVRALRWPATAEALGTLLQISP